MFRETRTLKGLFPDPNPPQRKNFIKENMKNLRKMEQLFHSNGKGAKDMKLPILRQTKILSKHAGLGDNIVANSNEGLNESNINKIINSEVPKLLKQKSFAEESKNRKKSVHTLKPTKKVSRTPLNENARKSHFYTSQENKIDNHEKIKARSDGDLAHTESNNVTVDKIDTITSKTNHGRKNQGVQTLETNDLDSLYLEGVIRYPSNKYNEMQKEKPSNKTQVSEKNKSNKNATDNNTDNIKLNAERISLASKLASQLHGAPPSNYRIGVVPKYIKNRKEALEKDHLAKEAAKNTGCPAGHISVPDSERRNTLSVLKKNYEELVAELNMLPIRTDTLRSHNRKMEIEKQLTKLEEAIKIFSRPKVFVKIDD